MPGRWLLQGKGHGFRFLFGMPAVLSQSSAHRLESRRCFHDDGWEPWGWLRRKTLSFGILLQADSDPKEARSCCNNRPISSGLPCSQEEWQWCFCWRALARCHSACGPNFTGTLLLTHHVEPVVRGSSSCEHSTVTYPGSWRSVLCLELVQEVLPAVM